MMWYIIIFLLCFLGFILNNYIIKEEKYKKIIDISLIILLCFITGTRYNIGGYDYHVYETVYNNVPLLGNFNFFTVHNIPYVFNMETGFLFLCSIFKTIGLTYYSFTLICSIIFYLCLYKGLRKYTKNFTFLIIVFLYKLFIFQTFVLTRQMLCLGGFFIMLKYLEKGEFWKYLIGCILLSTIHISALIFIPIYFLRKIKLTKKKLKILAIIFIPTTLFSLFKIPILNIFVPIINLFGAKSALYLKYLNSSGSINILNTIEYLLLLVIIIYKYDDLIKQNPRNELWIKIFLLMLPLLTMFRGYEVLVRIKDYFIIVYAFIIDEIFKTKFNILKIPKPLIALSIVALCFFGYQNSIENFGKSIMPYNSYINDNVKLVDFGG